MSESSIITAGGHKVRFEDGSESFVEKFWLQRNVVNTREFKKFCDETGYRTTAECCNDMTTYLDHLEIYGDLTRKQQDELPVGYISWHDADAYCRWKGGRLLTDAEWMAASLGATPVHPRNKEEEYELAAEAALDTSRAYLSGPEYTGTLIEGGRKAIIRVLPAYILTPDWQKIERINRQPGSLEEYDSPCVFRVCWSELPEGL